MRRQFSHLFAQTGLGRYIRSYEEVTTKKTLPLNVRPHRSQGLDRWRRTPCCWSRRGTQRHLRNRQSFLSFPYVCSRACLGKKIAFMYKWHLKATVFSLAPKRRRHSALKSAAKVTKEGSTMPRVEGGILRIRLAPAPACKKRRHGVCGLFLVCLSRACLGKQWLFSVAQ